jgi:hypothetical protein
MTKVTTLFGEFDDDALKKLKGYVGEAVLHMHRNDSNNAAIKDIIDAAHDELKVPKKIIKRMAKFNTRILSKLKLRNTKSSKPCLKV